MTDTSGLTCAQLQELGAELALGVLSARERATAMAHLQTCPSCRENLCELASVADGLLDLIPGSEPPIGFEARVLQRIGIPPERRAPRRTARHRLVLAAAVSAVLGLGGLGGWVVAGLTETAAPTVATAPGSYAHAELLTAQLTASGQTIGHAYVSTGPTPWMYMSVDLDGIAHDITLQCQIQRGDGSTATLGSFPLTDGYGHWDGPYPAGSAPITGIRLLTGNGSVLASATFTTTYPPSWSGT